MTACLAALLLAAIPIPCEGDIAEAVQASAGQAIVIGPGKCRLGRPIEVKAPTVVAGEGPWHTFIEAPFGAFNVGAPLNLHDIALWRADKPVFEPAIGVMARATVTIERAHITGFTVGIYVHASVADFGTNANAWRIWDVRVSGSGHAGILVRGRDSNVGVAVGLRAQANCEHATLFTDVFGPCAGIVDRSFFGSVWISPLVATTGEVDPVTRLRKQHPPYILLGDSQHSVLVGPYRERDQAPAEFDQATIALGGLAPTWVGNGLRIDGPQFNALVVRNTKDPTNVVEFRAGARAASGTFYELAADAIDNARPLRVKSEPSRMAYRTDIANQIVVGRIYQADATINTTDKR